MQFRFFMNSPYKEASELAPFVISIFVKKREGKIRKRLTIYIVYFGHGLMEKFYLVFVKAEYTMEGIIIERTWCAARWRFATSPLTLTVWCNQMGTICAEMLSWTALTWYTVLKTEFKTKNMKNESFGSFIMKIFKSDGRKCMIKDLQHLTTRNY